MAILSITATRMIASDGKFDSQNRYLRQVSSGIAVIPKGGRTMFDDGAGQIRIVLGQFSYQDPLYAGPAYTGPAYFSVQK